MLGLYDRKIFILSCIEELVPLEVLDIEFLNFEERMVRIPKKELQNIFDSQNSQIMASVGDNQPSNQQL